MPLELLVATVCIGNYSCDKALKAYYYERPNIRKFQKKSREYIVDEVGEWVLYAVPAAALAINDKAYQIKITRNISCSFDSTNAIVLYRLDF